MILLSTILAGLVLLTTIDPVMVTVASVVFSALALPLTYHPSSSSPPTWLQGGPPQPMARQRPGQRVPGHRPGGLGGRHPVDDLDQDGKHMTRHETVDAQLELMARQIVDDDGRMVAKVDDVELTTRYDGRLVVTGLLTGPGALGPRLGGALGSISTDAWSRLSGRDSSQPQRIDISVVSDISQVIRLNVSRRTADLDGFEVWNRGRIISALPGARKDPS